MRMGENIIFVVVVVVETAAADDMDDAAADLAINGNDGSMSKVF